MSCCSLPGVVPEVVIGLSVVNIASLGKTSQSFSTSVPCILSRAIYPTGCSS